MIHGLDHFIIAFPDLILLLTLVLVIFAGFLSDLNQNRRAIFCIVATGLITSCIFSFLLFKAPSILVFNSLYIADDLGYIMKFFISLSVLLCFTYVTLAPTANELLDNPHHVAPVLGGKLIDFYSLALISTLGMMILASANSLLTVYLGLELLSLPLYALAAIQRRDDLGAEGAMKYFVMGAIASGMLLYGFSFIYGLTGELELNLIAKALENVAIADKPLVLFALVFIVAGIGFKLAAVPFHMWAPDVYQGSSTPVTLLISTAPKIAALGMALRLLSMTFYSFHSSWSLIIIVLALLSTGFGNLLAIAQTNLKRLFAYSAISHSGYALFGLLAGTEEGYSAALFYMIVYTIMTAAVFGLLIILSKDKLAIENIDDLKGLNKTNPWLAFMMLIVLFSMAGVPPTVGFFVKLAVLKALINVHLIGVAVLGLIFAVIGAFYYLRVVKVMYFDDPIDNKSFQINNGAKILFSLNCLILLFLGIFPGLMLDAIMDAVASFYISP